MRTICRISALLLTLVVVLSWLLAGSNHGWTKTSVAHKEKDPVTELEVDMYERRLVPGIDFLVGGLILAAMMGAVSFFFKKNIRENSPAKNPLRT